MMRNEKIENLFALSDVDTYFTCDMLNDSIWSLTIKCTWSSITSWVEWLSEHLGMTAI